MPVPFSDTECWDNIRASDPRWIQKVAKEGVNIPKDGIEMVSSPDMTLSTMSGRDDGLVYAMVKAIYDDFDNISKATPTTYGLAADRQILNYVVPFHDGAIRYFKEAGLWNDELQAHNDALVKRQDVLAAAWNETTDRGISDDAEFAAAWKEARIKALEAAGFEVPVKDW